MIRCQAIGAPDDEGEVRVFFELNGQPRTVRIANRRAAAQARKTPKAEESNPCHVAAPMPGMVASVAVGPGQAVKARDLLLTIEAMKMETAIHAEPDATVKALVTPAGTQVDAKDLLIEFED